MLVIMIFISASLLPFFVDDTEIFVLAETGTSNDAIKYAAQVGRLDIVSLILAVVSVAIVVFSISSFVFVRNEILNKAEAAAREILIEKAPIWVKEHLNENGPSWVREHLGTDQMSEFYLGWLMTNRYLLDNLAQKVMANMEITNGSDLADDFASAIDPDDSLDK